jgi:hypothetical protein
MGRMYRGRRTAVSKKPPLTQHQKRLMFILDTFGKKYPREAADTITAIQQTYARYGHNRWWGSTEDPVNSARESVLKDDPYQTAPPRHALDRHTRWVLDQVRKVWSKSRLPWSHWTPEEELRIRTAQKMPHYWSSDEPPTLWHFSVRKRLNNFMEALPEIVEWIEGTNGSPRGPWPRVLKQARAWHAAEIERALLQANTSLALLGLAEAKRVGELSEGWTLEALTTKDALKAEGAALVHCIGGYGYFSRMQRGDIGIYSLRHHGVPKVSFEIELRGKNLQILQAKGIKNTRAGFSKGNVGGLDQMETPQQLAAVADMDVLVNVLKAAQLQGWSYSGKGDMHGVATLLRLLKAAADAQEAASARTKKKSRRGQAAIAEHLTHGNAAELFKRAKKPEEGLKVKIWSTNYVLRREDRNGTTVYSLWRARPRSKVMRSTPVISRHVPGNMRKSWRRHGETEEAQQRMAEVPYPLLEVWPKKWVVRASAWEGFSGNPVVGRLSPAEFIIVSGDAGHLSWSSWLAASRGTRVAGAFKAPDWSLWHLPSIKQGEIAVVVVNRKGAPLAIYTETPGLTQKGALRWPKRYWQEQRPGYVPSRRLVVADRYVTETSKGGGFDNLPTRSHDGRWLEDDAE